MAVRAHKTKSSFFPCAPRLVPHLHFGYQRAKMEWTSSQNVTVHKDDIDNYAPAQFAIQEECPRRRNVYSDSMVALTDLQSNVILECHSTLNSLAKQRDVELFCIPEHNGIRVNEMTLQGWKRSSQLWIPNQLWEYPTHRLKNTSGCERTKITTKCG